MSEFAGFAIPEKNYFPMPNVWTDICADIDSLAELKVVQYVLRHTWGYREYGTRKRISVDEFMRGRKRTNGSRMDKGTGLSEPSVKDGIKRALAHGYLTCDVDDSDMGNVKKYYALKMLEDKEVTPDKEATPQDTCPPDGVGNLPPGDKILAPQGDKEVTPGGQVSTPRTEKDTKETHFGKTLKEKHASASASFSLEEKAVDISQSPPVRDNEKPTGENDTQSQKAKPKGKRKPREKPPEKPKEPAIVLAPEEQAVWEAWCKAPWHGGAVPTHEKNDAEHLHKLAAYQATAHPPTLENLKKCKAWAMSREVDRNGWYRLRGWSLYAQAKEYPKWVSLQFEDDTGNVVPFTPPSRKFSSYDDPDYDISGEFYPSEAERRKHRAAASF